MTPIHQRWQARHEAAARKRDERREADRVRAAHILSLDHPAEPVVVEQPAEPRGNTP